MEERQARRRLAPLFPRGREDAALGHVHLFSYPVWRVAVTWRTPGFLGLGEARRQAVLVLDGLDHRPLVPNEGRLRPQDDLRLAHARDWLAPFDLSPVSPSLAGVLPLNYRDFAGQDDVRRRVEQTWRVEVDRVELVYLPFWVGVTTPYRSRERSVRCVDALLGGAFSPEVRAEVPAFDEQPVRTA